MRILVINVNRTGSTALCKGLSSYFNIPYFPTPFRDEILGRPKKLEWYSSNNNLLHQRIIEVDHEFCKKLCKIYKHIIITSRYNLKEAAESYAFMLDKVRKKDIHWGSHTTRYVYKEPDNYQKIYKMVLDTHEIALKLSDEFNIPITYYEDLFYNSPEETLNSLKLGVDYNRFKNVLDTNKKLRVTKTGSLL